MSDTARFEITVTADRLTVQGEIDAHTAPDLAEHLRPLTAAGTRASVDLAGVTFIDSSGLRVLIEAHRAAEASGGRVVLLHPSQAVTRLFEISGLDGHLHLSP